MLGGDGKESKQKRKVYVCLKCGFEGKFSEAVFECKKCSSRYLLRHPMSIDLYKKKQAIKSL